MEAGDKYRTGRSFKEFEIENNDPLNPVVIVLTIGEGDYNRQIVQGNISITPGITRADGTFGADTRIELVGGVYINSVERITTELYQTIKDVNLSTPMQGLAYFPTAGKIYGVGNPGTLRVIDLATGQVSAVNDQFGGTLYLLRQISGALSKDEQTFFTVIFGGASNSQVFVAELDSEFSIVNIISTGITGLTSYSLTIIEGVIYIGQRDSTVLNFYRVDAENGAVRIAELAGFGSVRALYYDDKTKRLITSEQRPGSLPNDLTGVAALSWPALEPTPLIAGDLNLSGGGHLVPSNRAAVLPRAAPLNNLIFSTEEWTQTAAGVFETCANSTLILPGQKITEANIIASETQSGVVVNGEVIKMMLELFKGSSIRGDYLGYVYGVEFDNADNIAPKTVKTGGQPFSLAGKEDQFICEFPQTVKLFVSDGIFEEQD
jgi:hypothetical protein